MTSSMAIDELNLTVLGDWSFEDIFQTSLLSQQSSQPEVFDLPATDIATEEQSSFLVPGFEAQTITPIDNGHLDVGQSTPLETIVDISPVNSPVNFTLVSMSPAIESTAYFTDFNTQPDVSIEPANNEADLRIDKIWANASKLEFEQDLELNLHVSNVGTAEATHAQTTFYWSETDHFDFDTAHRIDADGHGTLKVGELDTNEFESINYSNLAKYGTGYVFGVIASDQTSSELEHGNNVSQGVYFEIETPLADLSVASIEADDTTLDLGQSLVVRLHVENEGSARAQNTSSNFYWSATDEFEWDTAVLVDNDAHGTLSVGEYDDNEYEHISYSSLRDLGSGFVFAVIDAENEIAESNDLNNVSDALEFWI